MTIVSFHQVDFSYERNYLLEQIENCRQHLKNLIENHLTEKSQKRLDFLFDFFSEPTFLDRFFTTTDSNDSWFNIKTLIIENINHLLEKEYLF